MTKGSSALTESRGSSRAARTQGLLLGIDAARPQELHDVLLLQAVQQPLVLRAGTGDGCQAGREVPGRALCVLGYDSALLCALAVPCCAIRSALTSSIRCSSAPQYTQSQG